MKKSSGFLESILACASAWTFASVLTLAILQKTATAAECLSSHDIFESVGDISGTGCDLAAKIALAQSTFPQLTDEAAEILAADRPHVLAASNALNYPAPDLDRIYATTHYALELLERQSTQLNLFQYWAYRFLLEQKVISTIEAITEEELPFSLETLEIQARAELGLREDLSELGTFFECFVRLDVPDVEWRRIVNSPRFGRCLGN